MALILLTLIGSLFGWLASIITRTEHAPAILKDIGVGVLGALVGGLLASNGALLGGLSVNALLAALMGAVALLLAYNLLIRARVSR